jgi:hypothetical protein
VERYHGPDQDRLVKELRLAGISTIEGANKFPGKTYLPKINGKFSCPEKRFHEKGTQNYGGCPHSIG